MPQLLIDGVLVEISDEALAEMSPPPVAVPEPIEIPALAFRRRFTAEERAAFTLAASRALEAGDPTLQVALDDMNAAQAIDLLDPLVAGMLQQLVQLGLLAPDRPAQILATTP